MNAGSSLADVATNIDRQPLSSLIKSFNYGNGMTRWNPLSGMQACPAGQRHRSDYKLDIDQLYDGSNLILDRTHTYTDDINQTNLWDNITPAHNQSSWYTANNRLKRGFIKESEPRQV